MITNEVSSSVFNATFVESDRLNLTNGTGSGEENNNSSSTKRLNNSDIEPNLLLNSNIYDDASKNKFNSFPMRQKKQNEKLKKTPKSAVSLTLNRDDHYITLPEDELNLNVRLARTRAPENERLKQLLRNNCWPSKHPIRKYLWKCLLQISSDSTSNKQSNNNSPNNSADKENIRAEIICNENEYNKQLNHIFGKLRDIEISLPEFTNCSSSPSSPLNSSSGANMSDSFTFNSSNHLNYYNLNSKGRQAIKRILCVYEYNYPQVTFSPGLVSISSLLLHYMQEHEVFAALCFMSSSKDHLIESKSSWETTCSVFTRLLKSYCKSSYEIISKYATDPLETIFNEWYWWIFDCLSFEYLVKIMDCFLFEGQKVLYRVSLAIVQQFSKFVKSENIKVNRDSIKQFCESSPSMETLDKLLKSSFGIRNLKRSTIKEFYLKEEAKRKTLGAYPSKTNAQQSKTLTRIDDNQQDNGHSPTRTYLNETSTSILTHAHLQQLWNWIPQRLTVYSPNLLFTTNEHGTSVNTLFNYIDELENSIIVIKTFDNEIFGAFCSGEWKERKQKSVYFGTGETFLFTLAPQKKIFKWVGTSKDRTFSNQEMFMRADSNKLAIGGGGKDGLSISTNLIEGTTNPCDTFENEPLCKNSYFQIAILEVINFN